MRTELTGIAETLLIPTRVRAYETSRKDALLHDPWAVEILNHLDLAKSDKDKIFSGTLIGTIQRTLLFDEKINAFIKEHPDGIIVNLGCGLDARYNRLCPPFSILWFDLDIEEVMQLRNEFFEEAANYKMLAGSMFDSQWMEQVPKGRPVMVFFEGVSMYFPENKLKEFVQEVFQQFAPIDIVFDVIGKVNAKSANKHPDVKKYNASFKWGIDSAADLRQWDDGIKIVSEESYMLSGPSHRWPLILRLLKWLPIIRRIGRVIHIRHEGACRNTV